MIRSAPAPGPATRQPMPLASLGDEAWPEPTNPPDHLPTREPDPLQTDPEAPHPCAGCTTSCPLIEHCEEINAERWARFAPYEDSYDDRDAMFWITVTALAVGIMTGLVLFGIHLYP